MRRAPAFLKSRLTAVAVFCVSVIAGAEYVASDYVRPALAAEPLLEAGLSLVVLGTIVAHWLIERRGVSVLQHGALAWMRVSFAFVLLFCVLSYPAAVDFIAFTGEHHQLEGFFKTMAFSSIAFWLLDFLLFIRDLVRQSPPETAT